MIKYLEDLLLQKTKGNQSEILYAQWNFDKVLVPAALQSVSNLFPHYSLHDETHSATIVSNIVRILGKKSIESLSAIDLWLILEAAYWHDLGMVIPGDRLLSTLKSENFIKFFEELQFGANSLSKHARAFKVVSGKLEWKHSNFTYEHIDGMRYIIAEYFRRKHGDISEIYINNPGTELSLNSPRAVIPGRLWKILGKICSSHTKDFNDVLILPFSEVGLDDEYAHPRFVACMLRLGDLLDLDNNRFSDVMLRTLSTIPADTFIHKAKHMSIESFRVDTEVIEVTAKCTNYETAEAAHSWFDYLSNEVKSQLVNWKKIAPDSRISSLPVIDRLSVELEGFDYNDGQQKPQFTVDTEKVLTLLKGLGIYENEFEALREILQNAVDATLLRIWEEHSNTLNVESPENEKFLELAKLYEIKIDIKRLEKIDAKQRWSISIEDSGTGISTEELKFLMRTGSSYRNTSRFQKIQMMPQWLKPAGAFGVGFQSIFMLTQKVLIETKSLYTSESKQIELHGPNSPMKGGVFILKTSHNYKQKLGTRLSFDYHSSAIPERYKIHLNRGMAREMIDNYDYFSNESLDIEIANIVDAINVFASRSSIPINLCLDDDYLGFETDSITKFQLYDSETSMQFNISPKTLNRPTPRCFYKGQAFETNINFSFLDIEVNVHSPTAIEVLTINRARVNSQYASKLRSNIMSALLRVITENFDEIFHSDEDKVLASIFLNNYYDDENLEHKVKIQNFPQWRMFRFSEIYPSTFLTPSRSSIGDATFGEILDKVKFFEVTSENDSASDSHSINFNYDDDTDKLHVHIEGHIRTEFYSFFHRIITKKLKYIKEAVTDINKSYIEYSLKSTAFPLQLSDIVKILDKSAKSASRVMIPCIDEYAKLRLNEDAWFPYTSRYGFGFEFREFVNFPIMVSPYRYSAKLPGGFQELVNSKLIDWVFENRYSASTTKAEIELAYKTFCDAILVFRKGETLSTRSED